MVNNRDDLLMHARPRGNRKIPFSQIAATWTARNVLISRRLIRAYQHSMDQVGNQLKVITDTDLWTGITREHFATMIELIEKSDADRLSRFLTDFGSGYTWFGGVTTGLDGYNGANSDHQSVAFSYFDKLICLAEGLGVLPVENPEQGESGNWGKNITLDPAEVAARISRHLAIDIVPPLGVIPVAGIQVRNGLLHYRHINALYLAARLKDLTSESDRICEFGAGLGLAAYYLRLMGRRDITLFDIPTTNVLSGFFLIGALGDDAVCLEGEDLRPDSIKIRANWNCTAAAEDGFHITANQDSFPEINDKIFREYVRQIERSTSQYFLSINHEVEHAITEGVRHLNVSSMLRTESGMRRLYRAPYWLRRGYVEELYVILPKTSPPV